MSGTAAAETGALGDAAHELLLRLLRGRPRTITGIRELSPSGIDLGAALVELESAGRVRVEADGLHYRSPDEVIRGQVSDALAEHRRALAALVAGLSVLSRDEWAGGAPEPVRDAQAPLLRVAAGDIRAWWTSVAPPGSGEAYFAIPRHQSAAELLTELAAGDSQDVRTTRLLLDVAAPVLESDRSLLDAVHHAGVRVRLARRVPWWLSGGAGRLVALSSDEPERPLSEVLTSTSPALVRALAAVFDDWFARGIPYPLAGPPLGTALQLRGQGVADAAIGGLLGVSTRTVQRMFADAMAQSGVRSAFELGAWWAAGGLGAGTVSGNGSIDGDDERRGGL